MNRLRRFIIISGIAGVVSTSTVALAAEPAPSAAPTSAVWQKHDYAFVYLGFTSTYSCDGLADKIRLLLIAAGARHDAKSQPGACASGFGRPDKFARANLTFYTLAPVDSNAAADTSRIPVSWRARAIAERSPRDLGIGDCELVEQFRNSVLPLFTTQAIQSRTSCIPHQDSGSVIDLRFESLAPADVKSAKAG